MFELRVKSHFDAAHWLEGYEGKCHELHGHRWEVEVSITGRNLDAINMVVDFKVVKRALDEIFDTTLDHHCLNKTLKESNPTAEFIAEWLFEQLECKFNLKSVRVWESPDCSVTYYRSHRHE